MWTRRCVIWASADKPVSYTHLAALGQLEQPAGIMNGDGIPLRAGGGQQSQAEYQGQQQGGAPFCIVHHGVIPPFHPVPAACSQ